MTLWSPCASKHVLWQRVFRGASDICPLLLALSVVVVLSWPVMLVSRNVFHVVSALQSIVFRIVEPWPIKHYFWCKNRLLKSVSCLLVFVIREYEIFIDTLSSVRISLSSLRETSNSLWSRPKELALNRKMRINICKISGKGDKLQRYISDVSFGRTTVTKQKKTVEDLISYKLNNTRKLDCWQSVFLSKFQQGLWGETSSLHGQRHLRSRWLNARPSYP